MSEGEIHFTIGKDRRLHGGAFRLPTYLTYVFTAPGGWRGFAVVCSDGSTALLKETGVSTEMNTKEQWTEFTAVILSFTVAAPTLSTAEDFAKEFSS